MAFSKRIQKSKKYIALAVVILALTSWGITTTQHHNLPEKADQHESSESTESAAFTPVAYIIQLSSDNATLASDYDDIKRKNIFGICWRGTAADNLRFAKQMGYHNIMYRPGMQDLAEATGINFMLEKPESLINGHLGVTLAIEYNKTYTPTQIQTYQNYYCLKNTTHPFPHNIATGWFNFNSSGKPTQFATVPDWQQKRVLDLTLGLTIARVKELERPAKGFLFGGLGWDEGDFTGDFSSDSAAFKQSKNTAVTLAFWTGGDSSRLYPGTSHEFTYHSDGKASFYKGLKTELKAEFPGRKLIYLWEPYNIGSDFLNELLARPDKNELMEDLLWMSEGSTAATLTKFADDATLFQPGKLKRDWVGSTQPNEHRFDKIKEIVGKAGIYGSWFGWFGRFNASGTGQIDNIYEIPNWHQLARCIPSWDNLCGVPLSQRSWNGSEYKSTNSGMNSKVVYARQHETNKLFVVFMSPDGTIPLLPGDRVLSVKKVDNFFIESTPAEGELSINENSISLSASNSVKAMQLPVILSPNPAQDYLSIRMEENVRSFSYQIINLNGKILRSGRESLPATAIPVKDLTDGTYLIQIYTEGKDMGTFRFIKSKLN
jgi:hypothetical protein